MKKILLIFLSGLPFLFSCEKPPEYKECYYDTGDDTLQIYNDVLNELVVHHFYLYDGYLGIKGNELIEKYESLDTSYRDKFKREVITLHNRLFNDTSQFRTICLRTDQEFSFRFIWPEVRNSLDSTDRPDLKMLKQWLTEFPSGSIDQIYAGQEKYTSSDFHLCVAKVVPYTNYLKGCGIGYVSFSKIAISYPRKETMLYYEYTCGPKCGFGEILMIEKNNNRWTIKNKIQLWIS